MKCLCLVPCSPASPRATSASAPFSSLPPAATLTAVRHLADYVIARHYPEAAGTESTYRTLLDLVVTRQAELIAKWLLVGFIHGVMNTDNMSIAGETIDYGPCAFMDAYDPATVYSSIDSFGRYAYGNQPHIAQWNLARLAETLLPLLAEDQEAAVEMANEALGEFAGRFEAAYAAGLRRKLGLFQERQDDGALAQDLLDRMAGNGADFTLTFRRLSDAAVSTDGDAAVRSLFTDPTAYDAWAASWRRRLADDGEATGERRAAAMRGVNPAFIPRNHLVEEALSAAVNNGDLSDLREALGRALQPLRRPAAASALRRAAATRSNRPPDILRHLTGQAHLRALSRCPCERRAVVTANRPGAVGRSPRARWAPRAFGRTYTRVKFVGLVLASPTRCRFCQPK